MGTVISPLAGKPAPASVLVDLPKLVTAYYTQSPDPGIAAECVAFGTSGHRGSSLENTFNEAHVLAICQAVCLYRAKENITGPLFLGFDTHALSAPAFASALEVLAGNGVSTMIAEAGEYTPTPVISHAILAYNRGRTSGQADGIVITPSHNPPDNGGIKYNPPHGGPADSRVTAWIQDTANRFLADKLRGVKRIALAKAQSAATTHRHDYLSAYVRDLDQAVDMEAIRSAGLHMAVDPLGGAGVHYWPRIAEHYRLDLSVVNTEVEADFRFMSLDWDGRIRMDPSSPYAMQRLLGLKDRFDIAFACDTDHDRHGIVCRSAGLLPTNHFLSVAIDYLFSHRPQWPKESMVGKSVVSSQMIDRVAARLGRQVRELPVGFKWFVDGLLDGSFGLAGEESAGASFARRDGTVWTTDKDGFIPCLLAAEITARLGRDPGELYRGLTRELGEPATDRIEAPASAGQKKLLSQLSAERIGITELAGEAISQVLSQAPGNGAAIGGIKVIAENGWFAARPSGTEDIYKIYAESFRGPRHLQAILDQAQQVVDAAIGVA